MLLKSCLSLAKFSWAKYSEWKETIHLKQQDSQPSSEQQEEGDKESKEDEKMGEKQIKRRSGRKTYQNQLRQNEVHQKDRVNTGESNRINATSGEVYESGSYEDQLEAVMNDLEDDGYKAMSQKSSKITTPQSEPLERVSGSGVEDIGAGGQRANGKPHKNSKLKHELLASSSAEDQCRYLYNYDPYQVHK